jgi:hypothetical protein
MTKINLNLINFALLVQKLQNDHPTIASSRAFQQYQKMQQGPHGLKGLRCGHKTKQTPIFIYIY